MKTDTMMSRSDANAFDITTLGSHAGKNAADAPTADVVMNCRRVSSLYSWQPQSSGCCSFIVRSGSVPLEGVGADRETDCLTNAGIVEGAGLDVRQERVARHERHLAAEEILVDQIHRGV